MKVYQAIKNVAAAMSQDGISKARKNQQQGHNFRGIDDVLNALSSALVEAGLVILPRVTARDVVERQTLPRAGRCSTLLLRWSLILSRLRMAASTPSRPTARQWTPQTRPQTKP